MGHDPRRFFRRLAAVAGKEVIHIIRDPGTLYLALGMPVVLIVLFGYGISFDLDRSPLAIVDRDRTDRSRELIESLTSSREFALHSLLQDDAEADRLFRRMDASSAVVIPDDYADRLARGETVPLQLLLDGSDGSQASTVLGTAVGLLRAENTRIAAEAGTSGAAPLAAQVQLLYNPALRSAVFFVPGLIAYVMALAAVLLTALTVAREWERGNMEQLFATPVGRLEIVVGKLLPYLAIGWVQALLVLAFGTAVFDVPVRGSLAALALGTTLFLVGGLGQGLLISVLTRNQQVATQVGAITSLLPSLLLSGFMFPVTNMPLILQGMSYLFPARYFVTMLRGIMLKGVGVASLWPEFLGMAVFCVVVLGLATLRFRRRAA